MLSVLDPVLHSGCGLLQLKFLVHIYIMTGIYILCIKNHDIHDTII